MIAQPRGSGRRQERTPAPPETGLMEGALKRVKTGKVLLVPASDETRGHAATGMAKFYKDAPGEGLAGVPRRGM